MADVPITFGEWRPDQAPHMSPALAEATNVLPVAGAYAPFPAHVPISGTGLTGAVLGFFATPSANGSPIIYAATRNEIRRILNGSTSLAYSAGAISAAPWWFASMNGRIIAGNRYVAPVGGVPGAAFAPLGGSPPAARVGAVVERNFLVLGNLTNDGVDGLCPNRVRWSGFNNPDTWGTSVGTQADFEDLVDEGGPVVAITGRSTGTVFQRKAITRMQFVGGSTVFQFTTVELGRGAISAGAVCDIGPLAFFRADDGFFAWDGVQAAPIGTGRVDRWFHENVDHTRLDLIVSGFDPISRCVMWAFPENGQAANSRIVAFSLADQKWSAVALGVQQIGASGTLPMTLESMPTPDTATASFDDPLYAGKRPVLAAINAAGVYGTFTGAPLASTIVTGDFQSKPGQRSFVTGVRPVIDAAGARIAVGERLQTSSDAVSWLPATARGVDGLCPQRADARYVRYRQTTLAGEPWTRAVGVEVRMRATGLR
jgi:hypothetical protein